MVKIIPIMQMSNNLVRLSAKKDTSHQLCFGGWYLIYRYNVSTKKCQQKKKNENDYDPCFSKDKQEQSLEEIRYVGVRFCKLRF